MAATPYQHRYGQPVWLIDSANKSDDCLHCTTNCVFSSKEPHRPQRLPPGLLTNSGELLLILRQVMLRNKLMRVNPGIKRRLIIWGLRAGTRLGLAPHHCAATPSQ